MAILFLDVDGVMNGDEFLNRDRVSDADAGWIQWWLDYFDPRNVEVLNGLTERTGASIVLSSTRRNWASMEDLREILRRAGLKAELVGRTPYLKGRPRGEEIRAWLDGAEGVEAYVILDDDDDMGGLEDRFVRIDSRTGLTEPDAERAAQILEAGRRP